MSEGWRKSRCTGLLPAAIYATKITLSLGATGTEELMSAMPVRRKACLRRAYVTGTSNQNFLKDRFDAPISP